MIKSFVKLICADLGIKCPGIVYNDSIFKTGTMMALYADEKIYIKNIGNKNDLYFTVAHELRHAWQIANNPDKWMADYKKPGTLPNEAYNLQPAEIDANAYAAAVMVELFGVKPLFIGMPDTVKMAIDARINEITKE